MPPEARRPGRPRATPAAGSIPPELAAIHAARRGDRRSLATLAAESGLSESTISDFFRGVTADPPIGTVIALSRCYGLRMLWVEV